MANNALKLNLPSVDELFSSQEERDDAQREKVVDIPRSEIDSFPGHPFQVKVDESMLALVESVKAVGVQTPAVVRQKEDGRYEYIAGHRRNKACELAGVDTMPCIVREMSRDEAIIAMVDSNLQREAILPSEKALAYKMKLEALNRQGQRTDLTLSQTPTKLKGVRTADIVGAPYGDKKDAVHRLVQLTDLIPELLEMVDNDKLKQGEQHERMAISPAVEISHLTPDLQHELLDAIQADECTPSLSQAQRLKQAAKEGRLDRNGISLVLSEEKPQQKENFSFSAEQSKKYFPSDYTPAQKQQHIEKALDHYNRYLERKRTEPVR